MNRSIDFRIGLTAVLVCISFYAAAQTPTRSVDADNPLRQPVQLLELHNEYFAAGVARLNTLTTGVGFSIEFPATPGTSPPPPDPKFSAEIHQVNLGEALDWLCKLDPRFTWSLDGTTINIFPRETEKDYLLNRKISIQFTSMVKADDVVSKVITPVSRSGESFISWSSAGSFSKPWTATFQDITVRAALNRIAQQLGPGYGWVVDGSRQVRFYSFHMGLKPSLPDASP